MARISKIIAELYFEVLNCTMCLFQKSNKMFLVFRIIMGLKYYKLHIKSGFLLERMWKNYFFF